MERVAWTDERLEERFDEIDRRFDEIDRRFDRVEGEIRELRREMRAGFAEIQSLLNRAGAGIIVSLMGIVLAIFLQST
jgi:chromosome segregation ATPase